MKKEKNTYIPPVLTVVEFKTERGYAASATIFGTAENINMFIDAEMSSIASKDGEGNLVAGYMDGAAIDNSQNPSATGWEYENGGYF